ncbi:sialoadhesin [Tachysurus vachellii]|uniref:sialoadhesin n=1 Tax=Tachysurus vachellii TaxID=175792 RepID=UPI00296B55EE|nr:sialoadhesin [Tachysurus vachellii]
MSSVWTSVFPWVFLCLFSPVATADPSETIIINKDRATKGEGSCVTISCIYWFKENMILLWLKDPKWNATKHAFDGTVVYSNTNERLQDLQYSNRVKFIHEPNTWATCSLQINDLKVNDSGNYTFRYIKGNDKYLSKIFTLTVKENPCKVHIKPPNLNRSLKEGDTVSLYCATSADCYSHPQWSGQSDFNVKMDDVGEKYSELNLTLNWKDDGRTLICQPPNRTSEDCLDRSFTLKVEYAPKETKVSETSKDVKEGEQVKISCSSKAQPNPNFTWFKHQNSFSQIGENLSLYVKAPADGGRFYCQAKNEHGHDNSTDILINVIYAPKGVHISPAFKNLTEGEQLTLTCLVQDSNPAVESHSYKWYKDDQEIDYQTKNTLNVLGVTQTDKGDYQCKAKNSVGETKSVNITKVSVLHVPQNALIQGVSEIKLGFSLNLKCVTEANPLPNTYHWYFKPDRGQRFLMLSRKDEVYQIENVAVSNAGVYVCSAQNVIGTGGNSSQMNVLVLYPPKKPNLTMKQVVKENEFYSVTCSVESSPQGNLMLSRSSLTNPENGRTILHTTFASNFLNFTSKASMEHAGVYTCSAKNSEGQNSTNQYLKVLYAPKNVIATASPGNELKEGSELKLTCKADSVPQVSAYIWKKSSRPHTVTVGNGQTLTLTLVKSSDSDHYFCITSNEMGSTESPTIYIRVKYRPRITIIHNMTSLGLLDEAVPVHLSCSVQCDPPATFFAWYRLEEKTVLSNNQNYTVQPQNPGTYYCDASNEIGNSRSDPFEINHNQNIKLLIIVIISLLAILFLIGVLFLILRIVLTKRCKGTNEAPQRSFFFSAPPLWSNLRSSGSRNNIRENLVMEGSSEIFGIIDNHSSTAVYSNPQANRNTPAGRPNYDIQTTYDVLKLPPTKLKHLHTEEDLTTVNYAMLQFMDNNPDKSVPSLDSGEPDYAQVSKQKHIAKEQQGGHEDYENVSGGCTKKQPFPNINWDSDTSESEDEVNYTKVSFTATSHHNPQKDKHFSDEEDKTEYSEVKI